MSKILSEMFDTILQLNIINRQTDGSYEVISLDIEDLAVKLHNQWVELQFEIKELQTKEKTNKVIKLIESYGWINGEHHKQWVLDQIIRILVDDYDKWFEAYQLGEEGPNTYGWNKGIAP